MTPRITMQGRDNAMPERRSHDWQRHHANGPIVPMHYPRLSLLWRLFRLP